MNLLDIKSYLMQVKITSLSAICAHFNCDAEMLRCRIMHWVNKGSVRCFKKTSACGGSCMKCIPAITEIYEWVGSN
jgi:putative ferrous iron transport protein C